MIFKNLWYLKYKESQGGRVGKWSLFLYQIFFVFIKYLSGLKNICGIIL